MRVLELKHTLRIIVSFNSRIATISPSRPVSMCVFGGQGQGQGADVERHGEEGPAKGVHQREVEIGD